MNDQHEAQKLDRALAIGPVSDGMWRWRSAAEAPFLLTGLPWFKQDGVYRRLPVKPAYPIRAEVDRLANYPTGAQIRFRTDSPKLSVNVELAGPAGMYQMSPLVQCGIDCYIGPVGDQRYIATTKFDQAATAYESMLFEAKGNDMKDITLYLPLYQGVKAIHIGVDPDASMITFPGFASTKRVIVYGTSIVHGACASRPGMAYPNMMSRRLPLEFISLAFSGNAQGEPELAHLIAEIPEPGLLVLDYEGNTPSTERLAESLPAFISIYRTVHPDVPILVISQIRFGKEVFEKQSRLEREKRLRLQQEIVERFRSEGDRNVHFVSGADLLGDDYGECSADSIHPNDLGFRRMSDKLQPVFERLLQPLL
ncbi:SGNH/GDSL hydrolase family protein [Paenibacillus hodogayensis]|uniref:SGNH/GDSL hydrolase family protein n=1 Tax=Paenibacillus hodogayensis TaxID=279208 RepID=A0ABV5W6V6_9BACL